MVRNPQDITDAELSVLQALWDEDRRRNKRWEAMTPEQQKAALNSPEEKEWPRHASLIFPLWSPIARSLAVLLGGLTSSQWSRLLQDGELDYSTDPKRNASGVFTIAAVAVSVMP